MEVFICSADGCGAKFTRKFNLTRHFNKYHTGNLPVEKCFLCGQIFKNCEDLSEHFKRAHKPTRKFVLVDSAFTISAYHSIKSSFEVFFNYFVIL